MKNKTSASHSRSSNLAVALVMIAWVGPGCGLFNKSDAPSGSESSSTALTSQTSSNGSLITPPPFVNGTLGVKNINQLALSMSAVTGVPMNASYTTVVNGQTVTTTISTQSNSIAPFLSADGNVGGVNASMLLSITGMAGSFCKILLAKEAALTAAAAANRLAHSEIKFDLGSTALTQPLIDGVISNYGRLFLRRELTAEEKQILLDASNETLATLDPKTQTTVATRTAAVQRVFLVPCTAVLSSPDFVKN